MRGERPADLVLEKRSQRCFFGESDISGEPRRLARRRSREKMKGEHSDHRE